jgi:phosphohistidine phosphatase
VSGRNGGDDVIVRRLVIVRHAKSDWSDRSLADHDRPLAPRGVTALVRMRDHLAGSVPPDLVLCSSARRARDTLDGIRPVLPDDVEVLIEDDLYDASSASLVDRVRQLDEAIASVMLIGHNPGLHDLAVELVGDDRDHDAAAGWEQLVTKFPTGAIAMLSFQETWADIGPGCADLVEFFTPRPPR